MGSNINFSRWPELSPLNTHTQNNTHAARGEMWPKLRIRLRKTAQSRERDMTKDRLGKAGHGNPKAFTIFMMVGVNCMHVCAWFIKQASVWDKRCFHVLKDIIASFYHPKNSKPSFPPSLLRLMLLSAHFLNIPSDPERTAATSAATWQNEKKAGRVLK